MPKSDARAVSGWQLEMTHGRRLVRRRRGGISAHEGRPRWTRGWWSVAARARPGASAAPRPRSGGGPGACERIGSRARTCFGESDVAGGVQ